MKRILVDSDLQVGSLWGLSPNPFVRSLPGQPGEKQDIGLNPGQKYLLDCWKDKIAKIPRVDICVLNGDVIDGQQYRQYGSEAMSTDPLDQVENALTLIRMMKAKVRQWFVIHGSDYHEYIHGTHAPDVIAKNLGADRSYDVLNLDVEGKIINFSHAIGATTGFYSATPLNKEAMWAGLMGLAGKVPRASMVVRSHVHNFVHLQYGRMQVLTTPGWQLQSPYMREKNYYRWIPDLGSIILEVGEEITVKRLKYAHPITPPVKIK